MFLKQKTQILIAHQKEDIGRTKKSSLVGKKSFLWFRAFRTCFWEVDHPLCDVFKAKTKILTSNQKEDVDQTQKSTAIRQKKFLRV